MRRTLDDVARAAGVSRATVSRVVNHQPGVAPECRRRVRQVIDELGYRPHLGARALANGQAGVVDLVIVDDDPDALSANPHYARVIAGVVTALADTDVHLRVRLGATGSDVRPLGTLLVNGPPALAARLHRTGRVVSLGRSAPRVPFVEPDNAAGARAAVAHLWRLGCRRIAAVHGPAANPCAVDRRDGYLAAVRDAGLRPLSYQGDFTGPTALRQARRLLAEHPDVDAVFAACDRTATAVLRALTESGRRVPDDVAVVGFDDSVLAAAASVPLTSVRQPVEQIAAAATRALLQPGRRVVSRMPVELVVRASTTPVRGRGQQRDDQPGSGHRGADQAG